MMNNAYLSRRRVAVSCAIAAVMLCLIVVQSCSGGGDTTAPTTTGGTNAPPVSPTPAANPNAAFLGGWTGSTSQGKQLAFLVVDSGVVLIMAGWQVNGTTCTDGIVSFVAREPPLSPFSIAGGSFTATQTSSTLGTLTLSGTLTATGSASGSIQMNDTRCSGTFAGTWTASKATGAEVDLTGTWSGSFTSSLVSRVTGTFVIVQTGASATGTYTLANGAAGVLSGTGSGRMLTFTMTQTTAGCAGLFSGHGVVMQSPEVLVYYYTGSDCLGYHTGGNGSASR